jgi:PH (Pleckstrin Homology) domain-containing protein
VTSGQGPLPPGQGGSPGSPGEGERDGGREVFRSAGSVVLSWVWLAAAVIALADLAVQSRDRAGLITALLVVAISGIVYGCAWRPRIVADSGGIAILNPLRDYRVPWRSVVSVDAANALRVHCAPAQGARRGKVLSSWAIQSSARSAGQARRRARAAQRAGRFGGQAGGGGGYARPGGRFGSPGYGQPSYGQPGYGQPGYGAPAGPEWDALDRRSAEFVAGRLAERAQHAHHAAQQAAGQNAAGQPGAVGGQRDGGSGGPEAGQIQARWAWGPIVAMALPLLALLGVALA